MDKYKLKKNNKLSNNLFGIIVFALGLFIYLLIPLKINDTIYKFQTDEPIVLDKEPEIPKFNGEFISEFKFDDTYYSEIYSESSVFKGHLINVKNGKELTIKDVIKDGQYGNFRNKIRELLLLKYPKFIIDLLLDVKAEYLFQNKKLVINYDKPKDLETTRTFDLTVDYNEIKDYLVFKPALNDTYQNDTGFAYDPNKVSISFTFDDGPNNERTIKLINALEDYKMTATFFMVANKIPNDEKTVKYVYDSHSEVGYHSYAHEAFTKQKKETIIDEFNTSNELYKKVTGDTFKLTRPPYGSYNDKTLEAIDNAFIRWNIDTNDWKYKDVDHIHDHVMENYTNNDIILFHDSYDTTVDAVTKLLKELYLKDVQVLSITDLATLRGITLENHEVYYDFK